MPSCNVSFCFHKVNCSQVDDIPWGPQYEHEVEMEFTPMDPRDFPGATKYLISQLSINYLSSEARNPDLYDENVMILGSGNFERELRRSFMIFIFFYKEKCEKCMKV